MRLVVTDVTEMHGGNYCVAGWDPAAKRMVRPLPNGANWTRPILTQFGVVPGASIDVVPSGQPHASSFPHRTEDTPVRAIQHANTGPINWFCATAPATRPSISAAFDGQLASNSIWNNTWQGVHVPEGTQVGSLAAVQLPRNAVQFLDEFNKLKVILIDGSTRYKVAVSSLALKVAWQQGGIVALQQALPATQLFHVRLGLARAFGNPPPKCYLMVNGIHG